MKIFFSYSKNSLLHVPVCEEITLPVQFLLDVHLWKRAQFLSTLCISRISYDYNLLLWSLNRHSDLVVSAFLLREEGQRNAKLSPFDCRTRCLPGLMGLQLGSLHCVLEQDAFSHSTSFHLYWVLTLHGTSILSHPIPSL